MKVVLGPRVGPFRPVRARSPRYTRYQHKGGDPGSADRGRVRQLRSVNGKRAPPLADFCPWKTWGPTCWIASEGFAGQVHPFEPPRGGNSVEECVLRHGCANGVCGDIRRTRTPHDCAEPTGALTVDLYSDLPVNVKCGLRARDCSQLPEAC